eukprot:jgi/Chlat1/9024/Chrsp94S08297
MAAPLQGAVVAVMEGEIRDLKMEGQVMEALARMGAGVVHVAAEDAALEAGVSHAVCQFQSGRLYDLMQQRFGSFCVQAKEAGVVTVTPLWVYTCWQAQAYLDIKERALFYPSPSAHGIEGLLSKRVCIAGFGKEDRLYIQDLATVAGAVIRPMHKKPMCLLYSGTQRSNATAQKLQRASSFGIPVVKMSWLEECVREWMPLPFTLHLHKAAFETDAAPCKVAEGSEHHSGDAMQMDNEKSDIYASPSPSRQEGDAYTIQNPEARPSNNCTLAEPCRMSVEMGQAHGCHRKEAHCLDADVDISQVPEEPCTSEADSRPQPGGHWMDAMLADSPDEQHNAEPCDRSEQPAAAFTPAKPTSATGTHHVKSPAPVMPQKRTTAAARKALLRMRAVVFKGKRKRQKDTAQNMRKQVGKSNADTGRHYADDANNEDEFAETIEEAALRRSQQCALCHQVGDREVEGEIYGPFNMKGGVRYYVHGECAMWCPRVYFDDKNRIRNLPNEVRRGQGRVRLWLGLCSLSTSHSCMPGPVGTSYLEGGHASLQCLNALISLQGGHCTYCKALKLPLECVRGATLGCCLPMSQCKATYHYGCAVAVGCRFVEGKDWIIYCPQHARLESKDATR